MTGGTTGTTTLLGTIQSTDPIRFEFTMDEGSYLRYLRLAGKARGLTNDGGNVPVKLKLLDEQIFPHQGRMDFVDNAIDRLGTIRGRAVFSTHDGMFTPGSSPQQVASGKPGEVVLVADVAIGTEQVGKVVVVVDAEDVAGAKDVTLGPVVEGLRVIASGLTPDDRVVVNGLMRVRPGTKVTPQLSTASTQAAAEPVPN